MTINRLYDYVIVGGGSAGSVLAGRLSENPDVSVCLIEAGPSDADLRIKIPIGVIALMGNPRFDWCYQSEAHEHLHGKRVSVPRGKVLGGSGSINSMVYIRGRASDYDAWARQGCTGWDWQSVLPRFIKQERNTRLAQDALHGDSGPLHVEDLPSPHAMIDRFVAAGLEEGVPANTDFNGLIQEGLGRYQTTMHSGKRWSPADAFLVSALNRPNLTVLTNTLADRIQFDGRRASTLLVRTQGEERSICVRKELILTAGAIGSPSILLRSGVGPGAHSQDLGILCVHDLPGVGANLHDHPAVGMHYGGGNQGYALSVATLGENFFAPFRFLLSKQGLLSSNTVEGGGFARTHESLDEPDVQFHFIPARVGHEGRMITWGRGYYCDVCVLKPRSRGRLELRSSDPFKSPRIDLNLLDDSADQETLLRGAKLLRRILARPILKTAGAKELVPGPGVRSDADLLEYIHQRLGTAYHPVGTCRMGSLDDKQAVVDPQLRVLGLENVRVADASIMPELVAGNTNAPTMMIAETAAELIQANQT